MTRRKVLRLLLEWVVMLAALVVLGEAVQHVPAVGSFDRRVTATAIAHRAPALNQAMRIATWGGSWIAAVCLGAALTILYKRRRLPREAVIAMLAAWAGQVSAVDITKTVVTRRRPPETVRLVTANGWSFPSGHAATAVVVFGMGAMLLTIGRVPRRWHIGCWATAGVCAVLVGFSRIELGVHWTTDVAASTVWTSCWLLVVYRLARPTRVPAEPQPGHA
jgi:membrane-associated phospholipid phosphatase